MGAKSLLAVLLAAPLVASSPPVERRKVEVICEPGEEGRCSLAKRDLLGVMAAGQLLMAEVERLKRACPPPTDAAPGDRNPERRT